jgi:Ni,Fe-hydrogenase III large subunit
MEDERRAAAICGELGAAAAAAMDAAVDAAWAAEKSWRAQRIRELLREGMVE